MTEEEWLASSDPTAMLSSLEHRASNRQYRLFAVACARDDLARARAGQGYFQFGGQLQPYLIHHFWHPTLGYEAAVRAAESNADGGPKKHFGQWFVSWVDEPDVIAYSALGFDPDALVSVPPGEIAAAILSYTNHPASYLRDIFGNSFQLVRYDPAWMSPDVVALARAAYDERQQPSGELEPDRLAVLSDALEEAGATGEILDHLRSHGPHVRGCWALDLVLGLS